MPKIIDVGKLLMPKNIDAKKYWCQKIIDAKNIDAAKKNRLEEFNPPTPQIHSLKSRKTNYVKIVKLAAP